jgi:hypothetical protein
MARPARIVLFGTLALSLLTVTAAATIAQEETGGCSDGPARMSGQVHATHVWTDRQVPGLGRYRIMHWEESVPGAGCRTGRGQVEIYGVAELRPQDAQALERRYRWQPGSAGWPSARALPPALKTLVPLGTQWRSAAGYAGAPKAGLLLAPAHNLAFFSYCDC